MPEPPSPGPITPASTRRVGDSPGERAGKCDDACVTDGEPPEAPPYGDQTLAGDAEGNGATTDHNTSGQPQVDPQPSSPNDPHAQPQAPQSPPSGPAEHKGGDAEPPTGAGAMKESGRSLGSWLLANWVILSIAFLFFLTVLSIVKALNAKPDDALGKVCVIAAVPLLSLFIGVLANRLFHDLSTGETIRRDVQMAALTTYRLRSSVQYVDERLAFAIALLLQNFQESAYSAYAMLELVSAKTATELAFGMAQQSASQFEMISRAGAAAAKDIFAADEGQARPKITYSDDPKFASTGGGDGND